MSENIKFVNDEIAQELNCDYYKKDMECAAKNHRNHPPLYRRKAD